MGCAGELTGHGSRSWAKSQAGSRVRVQAVGAVLLLRVSFGQLLPFPLHAR